MTGPERGSRGGPARVVSACACGGQASVLLVAAMMTVLMGAVVLGGVGRGLGALGTGQRAADLAALAGARAMHAAYPRLFEPAEIAGTPNPRHLEPPAYMAIGRVAAEEVARRNGADAVVVSFPDASSFAPVRARVKVSRVLTVGGRRLPRAPALDAVAEAELAPQVGDDLAAFASGGGYDGPLARRQGKPMRPDVAMAFDRLSAAARADGIHLLVTSGFRSDAEQAVLFARRPDPRWVAPPGKSLHRNATELDLGPASAYPWLAANARRFGFLQRYAWEPWHFGYVLNPRSSPRAGTPTSASSTVSRPVTRTSAQTRGAGESAVPSFVPAAYAPMLARAAQRWNVSAALLAAQIYTESNFNPFARSPAGAQGIAQFMPGTARAYGLANPFDAGQAIDAQGHMMRDLLRRFGSVALALAAYNAGPGRVQACGCIPPFPETRAYVAKILGLMGGAGEGLTSAGGGLSVRLVR